MNILVHRNNRLNFVGRSQTNITDAEDILEDGGSWRIGDGCNRMDIGDSPLSVNHDLIRFLVQEVEVVFEEFSGAFVL